MDLIQQTSYFIASFMITLIALVYTLLSRRVSKMQNNVFVFILVNVLLCCFCEVARLFFLPLAPISGASRVIVQMMQGSYFLIHNMLGCAFCLYFLFANGRWQSMDSILPKICLFTPFVLMELITITNPITGFLYSYNADYTVSRRTGGSLIYVISLIYSLYAIINLIRYWNSIKKARWHFICFFIIVTIGGVVIQFINPSLKTEMLAEALGLIGIMLMVENENDRIDSELKVYNRQALKIELKNAFKMEQRFAAIGLRITNYDVMMRLLGNTGNENILQPVADYLKTLFPWYHIYRTSPTDFIILLEHDEEKLRQLSETLYVHFMEGVYLENIKTPLRATVLRAMIPEELHNEDDVILLTDGNLPQGTDKGIIYGSRISYFTRSTELENAIARGIIGKTFEVYYQPVHMTEGLGLCALKALTRLHDQRLGDLMPGEFIPLAERNGMINPMGDIVIEQVCDFIASGEPTRLGVSNIYINLSIVQCMQPDFIDRVIHMVERYQVRPEMINFEIAKPKNRTDFRILDNVISSLKKKGFIFSMDDYGSGYSNIDNIFTLDFDIVKIDKSILWSAGINENGRIILMSSIRLVKELGRKILVEGVESLEQINVLEDMEVDYLQGYYFSKPVKRSELRTLIEGAHHG